MPGGGIAEVHCAEHHQPSYYAFTEETFSKWRIDELVYWQYSALECCSVGYIQIQYTKARLLSLKTQMKIRNKDSI